VIKIFIPAAGLSKRWNQFGGKGLKQLAPLPGGACVIERLVSQLKTISEDITLITHYPQLIDWAAQNQAKAFTPAVHKKLSDTIVSTEHLWGEDNYMFFSDVVLSDAAWEKIKGQPRDRFRWFGMKYSDTNDYRWSELFGCYWPGNNYADWLAILERPAEVEQHPIYNKFLKHFNYTAWDAKHFTNIGDWSYDVDFYKEYLKLCKRMGNETPA